MAMLVYQRVNRLKPKKYVGFLRDSETSESEDDEFGHLTFFPRFSVFFRGIAPNFLFCELWVSKIIEKCKRNL